MHTPTHVWRAQGQLYFTVIYGAGVEVTVINFHVTGVRDTS